MCYCMRRKTCSEIQVRLADYASVEVSLWNRPSERTLNMCFMSFVAIREGSIVHLHCLVELVDLRRLHL